MSELKIAVIELGKYLEYGERSLLASRYGLSKSRAYDLLRGKIAATDSDDPFIMACYDKALPRKQRLDKLNQIAQ